MFSVMKSIPKSLFGSHPEHEFAALHDIIELYVRVRMVLSVQCHGLDVAGFAAEALRPDFQGAARNLHLRAGE